MTNANGLGKNPIDPRSEGAVIQPSTRNTEQALVELVYELLDAHDDTARLLDGPASEQQWRLHQEYLRSLQRTGRELLAASGAPR